MNWTLTGWVMIILAAVLLAVLSWGVKFHTPAPRKSGFVRRLLISRSDSIEEGQYQQVVLGNHLFSPAYPGLGLTGLSALPSLLTPETLAGGRQSIASSTGSLAVIARQVVQGRYADGFSEALLPSRVEADIFGMTPFSFTAGLLPELKIKSMGSLIYLGDFGPEAFLPVKKAIDQGARVFVGAGSISAQAALFLCARDMLFGEEVFMLAPSLASTPQNRASLTVEDLLRIGLIGLLIVGAILKMCGVL